jgi:hypothetical protein
LIHVVAADIILASDVALTGGAKQTVPLETTELLELGIHIADALEAAPGHPHAA